MHRKSTAATLGTVMTAVVALASGWWEEDRWYVVAASQLMHMVVAYQSAGSS